MTAIRSRSFLRPLTSQVHVVPSPSMIAPPRPETRERLQLDDTGFHIAFFRNLKPRKRKLLKAVREEWKALSISAARETTFPGRSEMMVDLLGESSNLLDDLFSDLEDWEAILSALPEFGVDQNQDADDPPAPSPL